MTRGADARDVPVVTRTAEANRATTDTQTPNDTHTT